MVGGAESISVSPGIVSVRLSAFGIGRTWEYDSLQVSALRVTPVQSAHGNYGKGIVAFNYGPRTIRVARDIDEAEAQMIINDLLGTGLIPEARGAA
jgi:hypothetical protein